jgi:1,4-alpha-glucan branching enzyme
MVKCLMPGRTSARKACFASLLVFELVWAAPGQSSRPGWGSIPYHDASGTGVTFRVWAPNATSVCVPGQFNGWSTTATPLAKELPGGVWNGVWSADVASLAPGLQYKFFINYGGSGFWKHDPRARLVTFAGSASGANDIIYDPAAFNWNGDAPGAPALNDLVIYELHIGTFPASSLPTRFEAAISKLDYLKSLGVSAVELLPIAEFPGGNSWGYNPAQLFAVENSSYGGPDAFKTFVRACHAAGLAVLLDVVHNHYGPTDLDMWDFDGWTGGGPIGGGIYFYESNTNLEITPYGNTRPDFSNPQVRSFVADNFTMWLQECHVDGFRWDTPGLMMNAANYGYIADAGTLITAINASLHTNHTGKISIAEDVYNSFGFDSAWDTSYPYLVTPVLTNAVDGSRDMTVIANAVTSNVRYGGTAGFGRVAFLESHDVVGDLNGGVRLPAAIDPATPNSYRARKLSTLGAAVTFTAPGVPMLFQGQEMLENQPFDSALPMDWSKTITYANIVAFYRDLITTRRNLKGYTPGLQGDQQSRLQLDNVRKVISFHRWKSSAPQQDALVIANFSGTPITNYSASFPAAGAWYVHFNSDSTNYGADFGNVGSAMVVAAGSPAAAAITIGAYSALILSQTPDSRPQLTIFSTNMNVAVSWPSSYFGWLLYSNSSLGAGFNWTEVPPAQYQTNGSRTTVQVPPSSTATWYRLQRR